MVGLCSESRVSGLVENGPSPLTLRRAYKTEAIPGTQAQTSLHQSRELIQLQTEKARRTFAKLGGLSPVDLVSKLEMRETTG